MLGSALGFGVHLGLSVFAHTSVLHCILWFPCLVFAIRVGVIVASGTRPEANSQKHQQRILNWNHATLSSKKLETLNSLNPKPSTPSLIRNVLWFPALGLELVSPQKFKV